MKRRKFFGLLAVLPFIGGYFAKAQAQRQRLIEEGSRLVRERMNEATAELMLVQYGEKVTMELWADTADFSPEYKEEIVWFVQERNNPTTGREAKTSEFRHVWTRTLQEYPSSAKKPRTIILCRYPATPENLALCRPPR